MNTPKTDEFVRNLRSLVKQAAGVPLKQNPAAYSMSNDVERAALPNGPTRTGAPGYTLRRNSTTTNPPETKPRNEALLASLRTALKGQSVRDDIARTCAKVKALKKESDAKIPTSKAAALVRAAERRVLISNLKKYANTVEAMNTLAASRKKK